MLRYLVLLVYVAIPGMELGRKNYSLEQVGSSKDEVFKQVGSRIPVLRIKIDAKCHLVFRTQGNMACR